MKVMTVAHHDDTGLNYAGQHSSRLPVRNALGSSLSLSVSPPQDCVQGYERC